MSIADGWTMSRSEMITWLSDAHRARHNDGPVRSKKFGKGSSAGADGRAEQLQKIADQKWLKRIAELNRKRRREQREEELHRRRVGAAIRRIERSQAHRRVVASSPMNQLFEIEPKAHRLRLRDERDMYFEWIPRGIGKGKPRNYKNNKPRIAARTASWREREFQDKILYIERPDALEQVEGNLISNMGRDQAERLGCAERVEYLEPLSRDDANVYTHVILALPAALSPEGRAKLLARLCSHLDRLELPHAAALHKPDPKNSQENFHAHILLSQRPMRTVDGQWQFAASKRTWIGSPKGLKLQRRVIASEFNRALAEEKQDVRWTHRSRADDGLEPGRFTKRGGRGYPTLGDQLEEADESIRQIAAYEDLIAQADQTAEQLQRIGAGLDNADESLSRIERTVASRQPPAKGPEIVPVDSAPTGVLDPVANSQRSGVERQRTPAEPPKAAETDAPSVAEPVRASEPNLALIEAERQRQKRAERIEAARAKLKELETSAPPQEKPRLPDFFQLVMDAFTSGMLVCLRNNGELDVAEIDPNLGPAIEAVAMTTSGFALIKALESIDDEVLISAASGRVQFVDPDEEYLRLFGLSNAMNPNKGYDSD